MSTCADKVPCYNDDATNQGNLKGGDVKIYVISMSTVRGPYGPSLNVSYHKTHQDALFAWTDCMNSLDDIDPSTVLLEELDTDTMTSKLLESFEGNLEDYDESYGPEDDDGYAGHVGIPDEDDAV